MTKVTYYFGAGASYGALPIVNQIPEWIKLMIELLQSEKYILSNTEYYKSSPDETKTKYGYQIDLINDLKWLLEKSANHASIDTFAKKLYIKHEWDSLKKLKVVFSIYLILEQIKNKTNLRYDSFYASILTRSCTSFPPNVRVLSWNYDFQFEKAYIEYSGDNRLDSSYTQLNVASKHSDNEPIKNKFSIIKLNGTTNITQNNSHRILNYFSDFPNELTIEFVDYLVGVYANTIYYPYMDSGLSFAWEKVSSKEFDIIAFAKEESVNTEVLVVIGYSFPFFNREIDREIIRNMKNLRKVYFQAPDAEILKERFLSIRDDIADSSLLCRYDVGQFLLPNEL